MPMTIAVTRNAPGRFRGFLASCMLEVSPGAYAAPHMSKGVRQRVWQTLLDWAEMLGEDSGVMLVWRDREAPSGLGLSTLGWPKKELVRHEGLWLAVGALTQQHDREELERLSGKQPGD